jgi:hypothetical protein
MLVENHRQGAVFQRPIAAVLLELMLDPACPLEQILEFLPGEIVELQEMLDLHNYWLNTSWVSNGGPGNFYVGFPANPPPSAQLSN